MFFKIHYISEGTQRCNIMDSTLIQRQDVESTLKQCCMKYYIRQKTYSKQNKYTSCLAPTCTLNVKISVILHSSILTASMTGLKSTSIK